MTDEPTDDTDEVGEDTSGAEDDATEEVAEGACTNAADLAALEAADVAAASETAAFACIFEADILSCATENIAEAAGLTMECAGCFGEQVQCVAANCMMDCITPTAQACEDCRNTNCTPLFEECAGIPPLQ